jgi:iron-sulfur cluster repair protein YtfE (RIC family)
MAATAIDLLEEDHEKVKHLLEQLTDTTERALKKRRELLDKLEQELHLHTTVEEEIFYPAFRNGGNGQHGKMYFEALEEHRAVTELVLPDLKKTDPGSEKFSGRAKVLKELIEHHIEEEESEMFPEARDVLDKQALDTLGGQMEARRKELKKR